MMAKTICRPAMNALEKGEAGDAGNVTPASETYKPVMEAKSMSFPDIYPIPCAMRNPVHGVA